MNALASATWDAAPIPLTSFSGLPTFPVHALPSWLKDHVTAWSVALQTPTDLMALMDLSALAAALAGKIVVEPRQNWTEDVNLYTAVILAPGLKKSPAFSAAIGPLLAYEHSYNDDEGHKKAQRDRAHERRVWTKQRDAHESAAAESDEASDKYAKCVKKAKEYDQLLHENPPIYDLQLVANDSTPQAMGQLLSQNRERMGVFSTEGGIFEVMAGRYSSGVPDLDLWLKAWSGDSITVSRVTREKVVLKHPLITMGLTIQPATIEGFASNRAFEGRGLLARYLYAFPQTNVGNRDTQAPPVPEAVKAKYASELWQRVGWWPQEAPARLTLSPEASQRFDAFATHTEQSLGPGGALAGSDLLIGWGNKLAGTTLRIAGLLHCALDHGASIALATMENAVLIAEYLIPHARAAFGWVGADPRISKARHLLAYFAQHEVLAISEADLYRDVRGKVSLFQKPEDLLGPLALLEAHGYIRPKIVPWMGLGRKPKPVWEIHPNVVKGI